MEKQTVSEFVQTGSLPPETKCLNFLADCSDLQEKGKPVATIILSGVVKYKNA